MKPEEGDHEAGLRIKKSVLGYILVRIVCASAFYRLSQKARVIPCKIVSMREPILVHNQDFFFTLVLGKSKIHGNLEERNEK